ALREEARKAAETALALQPSLGEAILAKGNYYYSCLKDYDTAVRFFNRAREFLPNSSRIPESLAYVARRRGAGNRSDAYFWDTQIYRATVERPPEKMVDRLKEILGQRDSRLGYLNGELCFWLGWAQEIAGDRKAAEESWRLARTELEPLLKEQPDNYYLIED